MAVSPHDYISHSIFFFGDYDAGMTDVVRHHLRAGQTAWDIGAERGWFTLLMGTIVGSTGRVDAFEPFAAGAERLSRNIALNNMDWVYAHQVAVSDACGTGFFQPPTDDATGHRAYLSHCGGVGYLTTDGGGTAVPTVALDELIDRGQLTAPHLIKIDIEGAEVAALRGAQRTLRRFRPVLIVEYNRATARRAGTSVEELDDLIASFGYDRFTFDLHYRALDWQAFAGLEDDQAVVNVYCFPTSTRSACGMPGGGDWGSGGHR
jgi:FkbM family methyltransferase